MKYRTIINGREVELEGTAAELGPLMGGFGSTGQVETGHYQGNPSLEWNDRLQMAVPTDTPQPKVSASISDEVRAEAWIHFKKFVESWTVNFDKAGEQPDRLALMRDLGHGRTPYAVLVMAYECESLQELIYRALGELTGNLKQMGIEGIDWADRLAGHMVQISREGFPDLAGTLDHSSRWRRKLIKELA